MLEYISFKSPKLREVMEKFSEVFTTSDIKFGVVGGAVRDYYWGCEPSDYDLVIIGADIEDVLEKLPDSFSYGNVCEVVNYEGFEIKVCKTFGADIESRDYTINSAYAFYTMAGDFELVAPYGIEDIKNKVLRFANDPEVLIKKDPIKILRGLRLTAKYHLQIEKETYYEIFRLRNHLVSFDVPHSRVYTEMVKAFTSHHAYEFVRLLDEFELLEWYFPAVHALKGIDGGHYHNETVFSHVLGALKALDDTNLPFNLKLSALYHDVGKVQWEILPDGRRRFSNHNAFGEQLVECDLRRLKFPTRVITYAKTMVYHHMAQIDGKKSIYKLMRALDKHKIPLKHFMYLRYADNKGSHKKKSNFMLIWKRYRFCMNILNPKYIPSIKDLEVNGNDVMSCLHIEPSRKVGEILKTLFEMWQEGNIENEREKLLDSIKVLGGQEVSLYETSLSDTDWEILMNALNNPEKNDKLEKFIGESYDVEIEETTSHSWL
jgi:tRNA nucleotidyltransferase/poly(A) polymerase